MKAALQILRNTKTATKQIIVTCQMNCNVDLW